jgi:hypothetical protein
VTVSQTVRVWNRVREMSKRQLPSLDKMVAKYAGEVVPNGYTYRGITNTVEDVPEVTGKVEWTVDTEPDTVSDDMSVSVPVHVLATLLAKAHNCTCSVGT